MKKKIFLLVVILIVFLGIKEVKAEEDYSYSKRLKNVNDEVSCDIYMVDGIYSIKDNKEYILDESDCPRGSTKTIAELIDGKISEDELIDGENIYLYNFNYEPDCHWLVAYDGPLIVQYGPYSGAPYILKKGDILKKGTLFAAARIEVDGKSSHIFYDDKDYVVTNVTGSSYYIYYQLDVADDEPEPEKPTIQENYKLDLKCLNDKEGSHHCELYYNSTNNGSGEFEVKFKVQAKNIKGQITINDETEELESNKEYTVNGECSDADCKVLLAKFNTKDVNRNSSSSMEIEPVSLKINGEDKPINIENSKCEYSKVIENPKTSTYIFLVATVIFAVFAGLLIALRKKQILSRV